jgi:hypothetical protein
MPAHPSALPVITWLNYIPILTTLLSVVFSAVLFHRYFTRRTGPHLVWWAVGIAFYGLGTLLESIITLWGNTIFLNKTWYVAGALLGGYPLAQGSVYLLSSRGFADRLTLCTLPFLVLATLLVVASPVVSELLQPHRPTGAILEWSWIRWMTPFFNLYAAFFLIGGAVLSAWRFFTKQGLLNRAFGNALIALGALLPGIGGSFAKAGMVEVLYIGECIGLILIWLGYALCVRKERQMVLASDPIAAQSTQNAGSSKFSEAARR